MTKTEFLALQKERIEFKRYFSVWQSLVQYAESLGYTAQCVSAVEYVLKYMDETIITWSVWTKDAVVHTAVHSATEDDVSSLLCSNDLFITTFSCRLNLIDDYEKIKTELTNLCSNIRKLKKQKLITDILNEG